jgi:hypothetical protein
MRDGTTPITDEYMQDMLGQSKYYTIVLLRPGANYADTREVGRTIREHARRNFALRAEGVLRVVGPVADDSDLSGIGIFDAPVDEVVRIMDGDPGVAAGIFTYEAHPIRSFPGDGLPA